MLANKVIPESFPFIKNKLNYVITYVAYAMGGIYFFYLEAPPKIIFCIFLLIIAFFKKIQLKDIKILFLFLILFFIFYTHKVLYGRGTYSNFLGTIITLANAYLIFKIVGKKFFYLFINVVYVFAIIGLFFWILENLIPPFNDSIQSLVELFGTDPSVQMDSLILFAHESNYALNDIVIRNNGGFWEPGAYVTTLVPAYFYCLLIYGFKHKKSIVILFTIITTFSTTGLLALFVILLYYVLVSPNINKKAKLGTVLILLVIAVTSFFSFDFLYDKVVEQIAFAEVRDIESASNGRFLALKKLGYAMQQNPIMGKDYIALKGDEIDYFAPDYVGYGWMQLMARIGIIFFGWYLIINFKYYKRFFNANSVEYKKSSLFILPFIAQYILLFGQALYDIPLFDVCFVMAILYKSEKHYKLI